MFLKMLQMILRKKQNKIKSLTIIIKRSILDVPAALDPSLIKQFYKIIK